MKQFLHNKTAIIILLLAFIALPSKGASTWFFPSINQHGQFSPDSTNVIRTNVHAGTNIVVQYGTNGEATISVGTGTNGGSGGNFIPTVNGTSDGQIATNFIVPESGPARLFAISPTGFISRATSIFTNGLIMAESPNNFIGLGDLDFAVDILGTFPYGNPNTSLRFYQVSTNVQDCEFKWESFAPTNGFQDRSRIWFWSDTRTQGRCDSWMQVDAQSQANPSLSVGFRSTVELNSRTDPNDETNGSYAYLTIASRSDADLRLAQTIIRSPLGDDGGTASGNQTPLIQSDINGIAGVDFFRFRTNGGDRIRGFANGSLTLVGSLTNASLSPSKLVSTGTGTQLVSSAYSDSTIDSLTNAVAGLTNLLTATNKYILSNAGLGTNNTFNSPTNTAQASNQVVATFKGVTGQTNNLLEVGTNDASGNMVRKGFIGPSGNMNFASGNMTLDSSGNETLAELYSGTSTKLHAFGVNTRSDGSFGFSSTSVYSTPDTFMTRFAAGTVVFNKTSPSTTVPNGAILASNATLNFLNLAPLANNTITNATCATFWNSNNIGIWIRSTNNTDKLLLAIP